MEAHTGYLDDEKFISELAANNNLDLAVTEPDFNEEKQNYKKVVNWTSKEKYKGQKINGHQVIIRNSKTYQELDFDFMKYSIGFDFGTNSCRGILVNIKNGKEECDQVYNYKIGTNGVVLSKTNPLLAHCITEKINSTKKNKSIEEVVLKKSNTKSIIYY